MLRHYSRHFCLVRISIYDIVIISHPVLCKKPIMETKFIIQNIQIKCHFKRINFCIFLLSNISIVLQIFGTMCVMTMPVARVFQHQVQQIHHTIWRKPTIY